jgi:hypothetical protein
LPSALRLLARHYAQRRVVQKLVPFRLLLERTVEHLYHPRCATRAASLWRETQDANARVSSADGIGKTISKLGGIILVVPDSSRERQITVLTERWKNQRH